MLQEFGMLLLQLLGFRTGICPSPGQLWLACAKYGHREILRVVPGVGSSFGRALFFYRVYHRVYPTLGRVHCDLLWRREHRDRQRHSKEPSPEL